MPTQDYVTHAKLAWHHQTTMATARQRRKHTISQAKNRMRRTVDEIIDPSPVNIDALWEHFEGRCAYCGGVLSRSAREGHVDHADAGGGNHLGNLVLSCGICNGDDKREESWREFLRRTTTDDAVFADRETRIQEWLDEHSRALITDSPEVAALRGQIEALIDRFAIDCHGDPFASTAARNGGRWRIGAALFARPSRTATPIRGVGMRQAPCPSLAQAARDGNPSVRQANATDLGLIGRPESCDYQLDAWTSGTLVPGRTSRRGRPERCPSSRASLGLEDR